MTLRDVEGTGRTDRLLAHKVGGDFKVGRCQGYGRLKTDEAISVAGLLHGMWLERSL